MRIIDWHCDTILKLFETGNTSELSKNDFHVDIQKMIRGGIEAQFFAVFVKLEQYPDPFPVFTQMSERFSAELEKNRDSLAFAGSYAEFENNSRNGKKSAFLSIEEGEVVAGAPQQLREAYERGVRLVTLTWNYENSIGYPNFRWRDQSMGLKPRGRQLVEELNDLGVIIDVSHLSDGGFYDVAKISKQAFVASHSNARSVWSHPRNLSDDMIKTIADADGIIGLNFNPPFLNGSNSAELGDMIRHLEHIRKIGGAEVLALGSDFDGIHGRLGVENAGEYQKLIEAMESSGFTAREIELCCHENSRRLLREVLS